MIPTHIIHNGQFYTEGEKLIFQGKCMTQVDPISGAPSLMPMYGDVLFSHSLRSGKFAFDITFDEVTAETRAGIIINYQNRNGTTTFYQIGLRNQLSAFSLEYFDGKKWDFKLFDGAPQTLEAKKVYSIAVSLNGNVLSFYINDARVFGYTEFVNNFSGLCGISVCNSATATIQNIQISEKKPTVFAIMKFEHDFDTLYEEVIKTQCDRLGFKATRADEVYTSSSIIQDIVREISSAAIIIADITMDNPNVFYELGYAHALQKPTILLADIGKRDRLPFDISGYRTIFYSNTIGGKKEVEKKLEKFIKNITETYFE